jgi:hypothetical protein
MKTKLFSIVPKPASMMVMIHSLLVLVALGMYLLPSDNTAGFGFMLMIIIMYFDFPVERLFWKILWPSSDIWPNLGGDHVFGMVTTAFWFLFVGGFLWFCIGVIIEMILRIRRKKTKNA